MSIAFSSLQHLSLLYAVIEDDDVMNLTHSCPAIETLEFDHCTFWINTLELSVFPRLKKATFLDRYDYLIDTVLDHTGLESFTYKAGARCVFAAAVYASIKELTLSYDCTISALNLFVDLTDTFPFLEEADLTLRLQYVDGGDTFKTFRAANHHLSKLSISIPNAVQVEEINISCPNLEWFKFHGCGLKQICINCPSLRQFHYVGNEIPVLPLLNASPTGMEDIYFQLGKIYDFSNLWFIQMRGLIEQMARVGRVFRLSLDYDVKMVDFVPKQYGPIEAIQQPNVHLEIKFEELMNPAALVDGLIWSTRPTTITIYSFHQHDIVKEICQKLAKRSPEKTCERSCNKCWRHHLQDFEVESSIKDEEIMCHLATFVERDPYRPYRTKSSFKLCWRK
ncbi:uncharacterized protein LOC110684041 [Chenopodium quinoa]|uniref:uncharacterized protein LOC110684041 n=1 Tax=Chenopodium quinoa TaxID=63459 RepID=UPI000B781D79|nr:uncharacterized protein LOC110684041 [Chenopodium quinoa]